MSGKPSVPLEIDPSIIERNLLIQDPPPTDSKATWESLFGGGESEEKKDQPWVPVRPKPGFVAKTRTLEGDKVFINVCYCDEIPPPKDLTDAELIEILESEEAPNYKVPLSLADLHVESDKSGNLCSVYDVAINVDFFQKILTNELFKTFFMTVTMEGLMAKYNLKLNLYSENPYIILKNRKVLGSLQMHRIEKRPVRSAEPPKKLIEVISSTEFDQPEESSKHPMAVTEDKKLRIFEIMTQEVCPALAVFVKLKADSGEAIKVNTWPDRVTITVDNRKDLFDFFLPKLVKHTEAVAAYFSHFNVLRIVIPIEVKES